MNTTTFLIGTASPIASVICRKLSNYKVEPRNYNCKLLVLGGGTGGCTMAAKFIKKPEIEKSVIVVEPSSSHYYQPLWTLVGAGVKTVESTRRDMSKVLPKGVEWIKDSVLSIDPDAREVVTSDGCNIKYEHLIIALGVKNDYCKIPNLLDTLEDPCSNVTTIYDPKYVEKTWKYFQLFEGGQAVFTYPDTPIKCPGAPQKIAYLADSYFTKSGVRANSEIMYNTCLPVIFGVKKYADQLLKVVSRKNIKVNYRTTLKEIFPNTKEAYFHTTDSDGQVVKKFVQKYDLLHVTPPMSTPECLSKNSSLVDCFGYLVVDKCTLQHTKYPNIYGIGDCTNTPNSKTAAAIAKQCYVLDVNLTNTLRGNKPTAKYDGYGACPLVTSYNTCILAEFLYGGVVHETFPFDQSKESRIAYYMKKDMFPFIYWNFMLKGRYHGPEFVRRIVNPMAK